MWWCPFLTGDFPRLLPLVLWHPQFSPIGVNGHRVWGLSNNNSSSCMFLRGVPGYPDPSTQLPPLHTSPQFVSHSFPVPSGGCLLKKLKKERRAGIYEQFVCNPLIYHFCSLPLSVVTTWRSLLASGQHCPPTYLCAFIIKYITFLYVTGPTMKLYTHYFRQLIFKSTKRRKQCNYTYFTITYRITFKFCFRSSRNVVISPSFLENTFAGNEFLSSQIFLFSIWNMSLHFLVHCAEKSAVNLTGIPCT